MLKRIREATQDDRGFTLIELMVVVLIIAILIAIAIPTFLGLRNRAYDRAAQSDLRNALTAAKAFYTDNETYGDGAGGVPDFTSAEGALVEPSLTWVAGVPGTVGNVGVQAAAGQSVTLLRQSRTANRWFCIRDTGGTTGFGAGTSSANALTDCNDTRWN